MKSILSGIILVSAALSVFAACAEDKSTPSTPGSDAGTGGAGDSGSKASCTSKTEQGDEDGFGKYCDTSADCTGSKAKICSESNDDGKGTHFCVKLCERDGGDEQCGPDATCGCNDLGCGCTPNRCL